jgi:hypothetical protein
VLPSEEWTRYRSRLRDEHAAGWLTHAYLLVLIALANLVAAGCDEPSVAMIAIQAAVSVRTVRRARACAQGRGLLAVQPRFAATDDRHRQRPNHYALTLPAAPVLPKPRRIKGGQTVRPIRRQEERKRLNTGPDLLLLARQRFQARQQATHQARRLL